MSTALYNPYLGLSHFVIWLFSDARATDGVIHPKVTRGCEGDGGLGMGAGGGWHTPRHPDTGVVVHRPRLDWPQTGDGGSSAHTAIITTVVMISPHEDREAR